MTGQLDMPACCMKAEEKASGTHKGLGKAEVTLMDAIQLLYE